MKRPIRHKNSTIGNEFMVSINEDALDIGYIYDLNEYQEVVTCVQSEKWRHAINEEMNSMSVNDVWELVELPSNCREISCNRVIKANKLVGKV